MDRRDRDAEERRNSNQHPSLIDSQIHFAYFPGANQMSESSWSNTHNKSHTITAYVDQPGDGVLMAARHPGRICAIRKGWKADIRVQLIGEKTATG
jgi:hypothetical protein